MTATPPVEAVPRGRSAFKSLYAGFLVFAVAGLLPAFLLVDSKYFSTLVFAAIFATVAVSLELLLGLTGLLSLGQTALFAVGAYTSAILTTSHGVRPEVALVAAVAASLGVAVLTSPILRLRGFYFALATLALVLIVQDVMTNWIGVTGGASGFVGIGKFELFGIELRSERAYYLFAFVVLLLAVLISLHIRASRFGRTLLAIREDETAAEALGIPVLWVKVRVWLTAAAFAGLAGVVYAHYVQFVSPGQFGLEPTIDVLAAAVVGGLGAVFGVVLGVLVLWLLPAFFSGLEEYSVLAWGLALMLFMIFAPQGLYGLARDAITRVRTPRPPLPDAPSRTSASEGSA